MSWATNPRHQRSRYNITATSVVSPRMMYRMKVGRAGSAIAVCRQEKRAGKQSNTVPLYQPRP